MVDGCVTFLTTVPIAVDPRARRAAAAATEIGLAVEAVACCDEPARGRAERRSPRGRAVRELAGLFRLTRWLSRTTRLVWRTRGLQPTIVHAHDLDTLPAGWIVARRHGARLVYDAHELYRGFDPEPPRLWLRVASRVERELVRRSSAVLTVSNEIAERIAQDCALDTLPTVVLNAPRLEPMPVDPHDGSLRVIYQAAAGPGRNLADLPDVAGVEISVRVVGDIGDAPAHVTVLAPVPPDELVRTLAPFDVGAVIDRPETENAMLALPNKLFEYLMAGLAVVVPDAPAMADLVRREGVGLVYPPGGLVTALRELAQDRPRLEEMRQRARRAAVARFNAEAQWPALFAAWGL